MQRTTSSRVQPAIRFATYGTLLAFDNSQWRESGCPSAVRIIVFRNAVDRHRVIEIEDIGERDNTERLIEGCRGCDVALSLSGLQNLEHGIAFT